MRWIVRRERSAQERAAGIASLAEAAVDRAHLDPMTGQVHQRVTATEPSLALKTTRSDTGMAFGSPRFHALDSVVTIPGLWSPTRSDLMAIRVLGHSMPASGTGSFGIITSMVVAVGIAATTSIFALVDAVLLRPLPYPRADRIVSIRELRDGEFAGRTSPGRLEDWRQRSHAIAALGGYYIDNFSGDVNGTPVRLSGAVVSPGFFEVLGLAPVAGRTFLADEEEAGGPRAAVIAARLAHRLGVAPGSVLRMGGEQYTVVGVMPASLAVPLPSSELWIPKQARTTLLQVRQARNYDVIARARDGVAPSQVAAELNAIQRELGRLYPATDAGIHLDIIPLKERVIGGSSASLWPLFAAALLILVVTTANTSCLMVAATPVRERDVRTRAALGATHQDMRRLFARESLWLVGPGALAGALGAAAALPVLRESLPDVPRIAELAWHRETTAAVIAQAALMTAIFAIIPVVWMRRRLFRNSLVTRRGTSTDGASRVLVIGQLALATLLVVSAAGLIQTLLNLQRVPLGFDPEGVVALRVSASYNDNTPDQTAARQLRLAQALAQVPGVESVAASADMPGVDVLSSPPFHVVGASVTGTAVVRAVTARYFQALHIPIEQGHSCAEAVDPAAPPVALVNRSFVRRFFEGRSPLGLALTLGANDAEALHITGVVANAREQGYAANVEPTVYRCGPLRFWAEPYYLVRTAESAQAMIPALRAAAASAEPSRAVFGVAPAEDVLAQTLARPRVQALLIGSFAAEALLLAARGLYGVLAYLVSLKRPEFGVRLALGARGRDVAAQIAWRAVRWAAAGIAIGYVLTRGASPVLSRLVYGVSPVDGITVVLTAGVLLVSALCAASVPAWRASRIDPAELLRS